MAYIKLAIISVSFLAVNASARRFSSDLEAKVDLLSSKIAKIEEENLQLRKSIVESGSYLAFDCLRESSLSTNGIIPFDGCDGIKLNTLLTEFSGTVHKCTRAPGFVPKNIYLLSGEYQYLLC